MLKRQPRRERGQAAVLPVLAIVIALVAVLAFVGAMVGMMAWWDGDHMGMMGRGSSGADQTPVAFEDTEVTVEMKDYTYYPGNLTVNAGTSVTFVNRDSVPHNAVADDASFDTGNVNGGDSATVVVDEAGTHRYVCTYHAGMEGVLTVR